MTKNEKLIKKLESEYSNFLSDNIEVIFHMPYGVSETTTHSGTWESNDFYCEFETYWSSGEFKTNYHILDDIIQLLKEKDFSEISGKDFDDIELVETYSGDVSFKKITWDKPPSKKKLEELEYMDLYNDSEITDSYYHIDPGFIDCIEVKIRKGKDILKIYKDKYEFALGSRIKNWTEVDAKKFKKDYTKALIQLKDLQEKYNLLSEEGIEDLPKLDDLPVTPEYRADAYVVFESNDWKNDESIQITLWTEHGSAFTFCFDDITRAMGLRNQLTKAIDLFGRKYSDSEKIEKIWSPESE